MVYQVRREEFQAGVVMQIQGVKAFTNEIVIVIFKTLHSV